MTRINVAEVALGAEVMLVVREGGRETRTSAVVRQRVGRAVHVEVPGKPGLWRVSPNNVTFWIEALS